MSDTSDTSDAAPGGDPRATEEVLAARAALADAVDAALRAAGLPVLREEFGDSGVQVWVDAKADALGGVYARWKISAEMNQAVIACVRERRMDDPLIRRRGEVGAAMNEAVLRVLVASGFGADHFADDFVSPCVRLTAGPPR
ncbi:hypothetical protein [Streptomyces radicis]|uniref:Uncharacterized protein n=1 Tax=Streptomyces radicis TaxID=1750517 RepID=A0A3A9VVW7_9ACTN|nr:hypothetical protein [Streptomyces radicis]RKN04313.1 hypothetical protein D7319_28685 [Streptomyces radicis]RKN14820.1 hypothetical protein D7318_28440 [Streptomyces radicis]